MATSLLNICLKKSPVYAVNTVYSGTTLAPLTCLLSRTYATAPAAKSASKTSAGSKTKEFPVETDPHRLAEYCCGSNIYKEGEDVKLKPESEYPDWLWTLNTGPPPKLEELDPNSKEYWLYVRKSAILRGFKYHRLKMKYKKF